MLKPTSQWNYKNVINALDEMLINKVGSYMLLDADKQEENFISSAKFY